MKLNKHKLKTATYTKVCMRKFLCIRIYFFVLFYIPLNSYNHLDVEYFANDIVGVSSEYSQKYETYIILIFYYDHSLNAFITNLSPYTI